MNPKVLQLVEDVCVIVIFLSVYSWGELGVGWLAQCC